MIETSKERYYKKWYAKNREKLLAKRRAEKRKPRPEQARAHRMVAQAIRNGTLVRPDVCEKCKYPYPQKPHAHHDDYDRPLDVRWLCRSCHSIDHGYFATKERENCKKSKQNAIGS